MRPELRVSKPVNTGTDGLRDKQYLGCVGVNTVSVSSAVRVNVRWLTLWKVRSALGDVPTMSLPEIVIGRRLDQDLTREGHLFALFPSPEIMAKYVQ